MKLYTILLRLKTVRPSQYLVLLSGKFGLALFSCWEYLRNQLSSFHIMPLATVQKKGNRCGLRPFAVDFFFAHLRTAELLHTANAALQDEVELFGQTFHIAPGAWLRDPVSGKEYERLVFFHHALVENPGFGEVKYVMELNKLGHLVALAAAHRETGRDVYREKLHFLLSDWIATVPHERSVVNRIILDIAFRCLNLIYIILLCNHDLDFQRDTLPLILGILHAEERQMRLFCSPRWFKCTTGANHSIGEMVGLIAVQVILAVYTGNTYTNRIRRELHFLKITLDPIISDQGVYLEQSANYSRLVAEFLMVLDMLELSEIADSSLYYRGKFRKLCGYLAAVSDQGRLPNFGDNDGAKALYPLNIDSMNVSHILLYASTIGVVDNSNVRGVFHCLESGQTAVKTNVEPKLYFFIRAGRHSYFPVGAGSHAHNDQLSLLIFCEGKDLLIDAGTYFYNSGIDIRNHDRCTKVHNTLSCGQTEQATFLGKWGYKNYPNSTSSVCETSNGVYYSGECSNRDYHHCRQIEFNSVTKQLSIIDASTAQSPCIFLVSFLLAEEVLAECTDATNSVLLRDLQSKAPIALMQFNGDIKALTVVDVQYSPSYGMLSKTSRIIIESSLAMAVHFTIVFKFSDIS